MIGSKLTSGLLGGAGGCTRLDCFFLVTFVTRGSFDGESALNIQHVSFPLLVVP